MHSMQLKMGNTQLYQIVFAWLNSRSLQVISNAKVANYNVLSGGMRMCKIYDNKCLFYVLLFYDYRSDVLTKFWPLKNWNIFFAINFIRCTTFENKCGQCFLFVFISLSAPLVSDGVLCPKKIYIL